MSESFTPPAPAVALGEAATPPPLDPPEAARVAGDEVARTGSRLKAVAAVGERINRATSIDLVLEEVTRGVGDALGTEVVVLLFLDRARAELRVRASLGLPEDVAAAMRVPLGEGFAGRVAANGTPWVLEDVKSADGIDSWLRDAARSLAGVPLVAADRVLGVLEVGTRTARRFEAEDVMLLELVAARAASALVRAELFESERAARESAERLQRLSADLTRTLSREEVADVVVRHLVEAFGAYAGGVVELSADGRDFSLLGTRGFSEDVGRRYARFPVDTSLPVRDVALTREAVYLRSRAEWEARYEIAPRAGPTAADGAWAALPLLVEDRLLGALTVSLPGPRDITPTQRGFMQAFADLGAQALDRARLYEAERVARAEAERERERLAFLAEAGRELARTLDFDATVQSIVRLAVPRLGDWAVLFVLDEADRARPVAVRHLDPDRAALLAEIARRFPPSFDGPTPASRALATGELVMQEITPETVSGQTQGADQVRMVQELGTRSAVAVPLLGEGRKLGVLLVATASRLHADDEALLVEQLGHRAALALQSARLFRDAAEANQAKMDFLATMSHELRTPLNAIGGYVELMEMGIHGPVTERQRDALGRIQSSQRHLLGLITDVLNFAKLDAGKVEYHLADVPVATVIGSVEGLVAPQVAARRLRFAIEGECDGMVVRADEEKLRQVLLNILSNAIRHTPTAGAIVVDCSEGGGKVRIAVRDSGVGIPASKLQSIFEPFVQLDRTLSQPKDGTGLGLAISRELARAMGGEIEVESVEGAGSTFTVVMPSVNG